MPLFSVKQPAQRFKENFKLIFLKCHNQHFLKFALQIAGEEIKIFPLFPKRKIKHFFVNVVHKYEHYFPEVKFSVKPAEISA